MIQPQTQRPDFWGSEFKITDSDIEQIYNHFLEVEKPQTIEQIALVIIAHRLAEENTRIERLLADRIIYQPKKSYETGDQLVFPVINFAHGKVTAVRDGFNPSYGKFNVIQVDIKNKQREFAADLRADLGRHRLRVGQGRDRLFNRRLGRVAIDADDRMAEIGKADA